MGQPYQTLHRTCTASSASSSTTYGGGASCCASRVQAPEVAGYGLMLVFQRNTSFARTPPDFVKALPVQLSILNAWGHAGRHCWR